MSFYLCAMVNWNHNVPHFTRFDEFFPIWRRQKYKRAFACESYIHIEYATVIRLADNEPYVPTFHICVIEYSEIYTDLIGRKKSVQWDIMNIWILDATFIWSWACMRRMCILFLAHSLVQTMHICMLSSTQFTISQPVTFSSRTKCFNKGYLLCCYWLETRTYLEFGHEEWL